ncbi:hypothetical protein B0H16DRAFT_1580365 [Mycena metata]|uniref:Uncharacterized protein n=1 Tax=Mycena metata TaxID=1033252 RepID=A0AAD7I2M1_9AGAR|nr:hypothetical protein B0H16DRAFT_1580365 [Mycena metata]
MNSNTTASNATADSAGGHGGIGSKIKGAAQTINGIGENVRGTILGGVETALHKDSSQNDAIAAKGRSQTADGLANLKGGTSVNRQTNAAGPGMQGGLSASGVPSANNPPVGQGYDSMPPSTYNTTDQFNPHHDQTAVAQGIPPYNGPGNAQQQYARGDRPDEEPRHHRDDAISGAPAAANVGNPNLQSTQLPPRYTSVVGEPPMDIAAQSRNEEML